MYVIEPPQTIEQFTREPSIFDQGACQLGRAMRFVDRAEIPLWVVHGCIGGFQYALGAPAAWKTIFMPRACAADADQGIDKTIVR